MESRFRSPQHLEKKKNKTRVVISRSSNRYVDEVRHRESDNLPEEVAQECKHSLGEKDLPANEYNCGYKWETQVSKFVNKLVRHEHSRERETDGAIHWKFTSPKLKFRFQRDGGSNFTDRDRIIFI